MKVKILLFVLSFLAVSTTVYADAEAQVEQQFDNANVSAAGGMNAEGSMGVGALKGGSISGHVDGGAEAGNVNVNQKCSTGNCKATATQKFSNGSQVSATGNAKAGVININQEQ